MLKSKTFPSDARRQTFYNPFKHFINTLFISLISSSFYFTSVPSLLKNFNFLHAFVFALFMPFSVGFN